MCIQSSLFYPQWIGTWRSRFEQKTNSILFAHWSQKKWHQDLATIDFNEPRRAQYMQSAWKKHQDAVFWVDFDPSIQKGLPFHQTRSNAIILQGTLPVCCIPKVVRQDWRSFVWKTILVSSTTTKDLIETRSKLDQREGSIGFYSWTTASWETCSTVVWRSSTCKILQTNPIQNPICDRSGKPEDTEDVFLLDKRKTSRSHEIDDKRLQEELGSVKLVKLVWRHSC